MNIKLLIDTLVRRQMVLIAQLATAAGGRTPLAHVANQVFLDLVAELEGQGLGRKVVADMFGLALRSYQKRVQRLTASVTDQGRTLWEAVLSYIADSDVVSRTEVMHRFRRDDEAMVRGVLHDQVETGLVFKTGAGPNVMYRVASDADLAIISAADGGAEASIDGFVWLAIYKHGPVSRAALVERLPTLDDEAAARSLERLKSAGRIGCPPNDADTQPTRYLATHVIMGDGQSVGWEHAVADHMEVVVATLTASLKKSPDNPDGASIGGSTYSFDIWPGHPLEGEVKAQLSELRTRLSDLRSRVTNHNDTHPRPTEWQRASLYVGSTLSTEADASQT